MNYRLRVAKVAEKKINQLQGALPLIFCPQKPKSILTNTPKRDILCAIIQFDVQLHSIYLLILCLKAATMIYWPKSPQCTTNKT